MKYIVCKAARYYTTICIIVYYVGLELFGDQDKNTIYNSEKLFLL